MSEHLQLYDIQLDRLFNMWTDFWMLRISDRLTQWKELRRTLSNQSLQMAVAEVNALWSTAPFVARYLVAESPEKWPDPWELLAENTYCDIAKALGILYTIYFTSHKNVQMELRIYYDHTSQVRSNVVWINGGEYILNYWPHEIVNTVIIEEKQLQLLYQYSTKDLQLDRY